MTEESFKENKRKYRKKLFDASYFFLIGVMIFGYGIYNVREMLSDSYFGIEYYNVPRILSWFFDKFGPAWTTVIMFIVSLAFLGYFLFRVIEYRKNMRKLKNTFEYGTLEE